MRFVKLQIQRVYGSEAHSPYTRPEFLFCNYSFSPRILFLIQAVSPGILLCKIQFLGEFYSLKRQFLGEFYERRREKTRAETRVFPYYFRG
jgi:hypothetical protein